MSNRIYYSQEAEQRAHQQRAMMIGIFLLVGLGVGAILALLFAPKSGESIRAEIGKGLEETINSIEHEMDSLRKRIEESVPKR